MADNATPPNAPPKTPAESPVEAPLPKAYEYAFYVAFVIRLIRAEDLDRYKRLPNTKLTWEVSGSDFITMDSPPRTPEEWRQLEGYLGSRFVKEFHLEAQKVVALAVTIVFVGELAPPRWWAAIDAGEVPAEAGVGEPGPQLLVPQPRRLVDAGGNPLRA